MTENEYQELISLNAEMPNEDFNKIIEKINILPPEHFIEVYRHYMLNGKTLIYKIHPLISATFLKYLNEGSLDEILDRDRPERLAKKQYGR